MRLIPARLWGLAVLSGILQVLPFPIAGPVPLWRTVFCWFALLPLFYALKGKTSAGKVLTIFEGALLGYVSGIVWYLGNCYWIYQTMYLYGGLAKPVAAAILILFCLYLGLYHALFGATLIAFRRSRMGMQGALLLAPFLWVAVELARSRITGLPWDLLGITQVDNPLLIRLAPYAGVYGLSFVIAVVNALWLLRVSLKQRRYTRPLLTLAGVTIVLAYVFGLRWVVPPTDATATATLLQENLEVGAANTGPPESTEQLLSTFSRLSLDPAPVVLRGIPELAGTRIVSTGLRHGEPSDVVIWPESAAFEEQDPRFRAAVTSLARTGPFPMIVDVTSFQKSDDRYNTRGYSARNSASFISPDGTFAGRYDKMHLVPFGEYTPYRRLFFFAGHLLDNVGVFEPGRARVVFNVNGHSYGTFICYESIFGDEVRQFVVHGAHVLVNVSDDGWYGDTSAPWQHLNMVRMRAIENHRWVLRATNTGVTAAIDPYGRVTASAPRHIRTAIQVRFGYEHGLTFYARFGDLFAYLCAAVTAAALAWSLLRRDLVPVN